MEFCSTVLNNGAQFSGLFYSTAINCVVITTFVPTLTGVLTTLRTGDNPFNLTKSKHSRIGFKTGIIYGE